MKTLTAAFVLLLCSVFSWPLAIAHAAPLIQDFGPFSVTFYNAGDSDGSASGRQDWTAEQMTDVGASISAWDSKIQNVPGRKIQLHAFWQNWGSGGALGSSWSPSGGDGNAGWLYPERVWRDGLDYNGRWDGYDASIFLNAGIGTGSWNFGAGLPSASEYDFRSLVTHEVGHVLGFWASYNSADDTWGGTWGTELDPFAATGLWSGLRAYDVNLVEGRRSPGTRPENGGTGTLGNFEETGDVFFDGANAKAYYGGSSRGVPIYAPASYSNGSSLSHLDTVLSAEVLMDPFFSKGELIRDPSPLEWEMMKDMGWSIAIPEPSTAVLLAVGLLGLVARQRC